MVVLYLFPGCVNLIVIFLLGLISLTLNSAMQQQASLCPAKAGVHTNNFGNKFMVKIFQNNRIFVIN